MIFGVSKWVAAAIGVVAAVATILVVKKATGATPPPMPACDDSLQAVHHGGTRDLSNGRIRLIVLHSTEGDTARGAAGWFTQDASGGSAHVVVDDDECYRTLPDDVIPWGAQGDRANEDGLHLEMTGWAKRSRKEWLAHKATIDKAAGVVADWARTYGVPLVYLTADDLRAQGDAARGITSHMEITRAFDISGGHMDPGEHFPIDILLDEVGGSMPNGPGQMGVS